MGRKLFNLFTGLFFILGAVAFGIMIDIGWPNVTDIIGSALFTAIMGILFTLLTWKKI